MLASPGGWVAQGRVPQCLEGVAVMGILDAVLLRPPQHRRDRTCVGAHPAAWAAPAVMGASAFRSSSDSMRVSLPAVHLSTWGVERHSNPAGVESICASVGPHEIRRAACDAVNTHASTTYGGAPVLRLI
jgi:hypothetical protein